MSSFDEVTTEQYEDDTNLAARQNAFNYLVRADPFPPPLGDFSELAGLDVIDVGCGNGLFLGQAVAASGRVIGMDLSIGMLQQVRSTHPDVPLFQADANRLPLADDSADVTLALWMLYHVGDIDRAVSELRRITRPGGRLVASTNTVARSYFDEVVMSAIASVVDRPVHAWLPPLDFNAENGADHLARHFESVDVHVGGNHFRFTDSDAVVAYVGSMREPIAQVNPDLDLDRFFAALRSVVEQRIASHGALDVEQRRAVFICR